MMTCDTNTGNLLQHKMKYKIFSWDFRKGLEMFMNTLPTFGRWGPLELWGSGQLFTLPIR